MSNPYRTAPRDDNRPDEMTRAARWDDYVLGALMLLLGGPRVILALATHESFGAEATIAAVVAVLGLLILATRISRRS